MSGEGEERTRSRCFKLVGDTYRIDHLPQLRHTLMKRQVMSDRRDPGSQLRIYRPSGLSDLSPVTVRCDGLALDNRLSEE